MKEEEKQIYKGSQILYGTVRAIGREKRKWEIKKENR